MYPPARAAGAPGSPLPPASKGVGAVPLPVARHARRPRDRELVECAFRIIFTRRGRTSIVIDVGYLYQITPAMRLILLTTLRCHSTLD